MAKRKSLLDLLDEIAPEVQAAFIQSIQRITGDASLRALEDAIRRQDTEAVIAVLRLDRGYFAPLDRAMRDAFETGGEWAMGELLREARRQGANTVRGFFDARNPVAEEWLRRQSSRLIVELQGEQRENIARALADAFDRSTSPRATALDLVGRVSRATGQREGGIIGLTSQQAQWAQNAFDEITSGDPAQVSNYFSRAARDRRFDRTVARAAREGRGVTAEEARRIVGRYRDGLLRYRGETIARTEMLGSLHEAQDQALAQMAEREGLAPGAISEAWDAANDSATRSSHRAMDGQRRARGEPFETGAGYLMRYPGDRSLGAPASEIIQCRCVKRVSVDFISGLRDRLTDEERRAALEAM